MTRKNWKILILTGVMLCFLAGEVESSVILKALVVNPSRTKTQKALLKAYLPKEAKPEDIIDLGDLKIDYDIEKALYYVYKEFELEPGESVGRSIEIRDIWIISRAELDSLTGRAKKLVETLKKTAYFETAVTLQRDIEEKTGEILDKQEKAMDAIPQTHIAVYRQNQKRLDSIKSMLAKLEKMVIESKLTGATPTRRVSVKTTWWVILAVIVSLGLLSVIFFIIWHRQAAVIETEEEKEKAKSEELPRMPEDEGEKI